MDSPLLRKEKAVSNRVGPGVLSCMSMVASCTDATLEFVGHNITFCQTTVKISKWSIFNVGRGSTFSTAWERACSSAPARPPPAVFLLLGRQLGASPALRPDYYFR